MMRRFGFRPNTLAVYAAIAGLAGCSRDASQLPFAPMRATWQTPEVAMNPIGDHLRGATKQLVKTSKLYVIGGYGSTNVVNIFSVPGYRQVGSITKGVASPSSLWVDKNGDVYVANAQDVTEYAPGGGEPICSYAVKGSPSYVTTDDEDQVFVTSRGEGSYHHNYQISYLDGFKQCGAPFKHHEWNKPFFTYAAGVAADSSGNIFVSIYNGFEEFKSGDSDPLAGTRSLCHSRSATYRQEQQPDFGQ